MDSSLLIFSLVFTSVSGAAQYSDSFARNTMLPLSAAAYSNQPQRCLDRLFPNATLKNQVTVQCDDFRTDTCSGFTAVLHQSKAIVLSFRGTSRLMQLLEEVNKTIFLNLSSWLYGGRIARYFSDAFSKIWGAGMSEDFQSLRTTYPDYEIWITGHSLGGSIASLAASFLAGSRITNSSDIKLVTFGQPRTGDVRFSNTHNSQLEYSFRVTHWRDIVPHIPMGPLGGYFHHKQEAFYKSEMKPDDFVICSEGEAKECSDGLWFTASIHNHRNYFGHDVSKYGVNDCVDQ